MDYTLIQVWEDDAPLVVVGEMTFVGRNADGTTFLFN